MLKKSNPALEAQKFYIFYHLSLAVNLVGPKWNA
jgi:hypothetical protein